MKYFFIYGTLKKGMRNHHILKKLNAIFIAEVETTNLFSMFDLGNGFPYVQDNPGNGLIIQGELYILEEGIQEKLLDEFEGVPNLYKKGTIDVEVENLKYQDVNCYFISDELTDEELNEVDLFEEWRE
jgi:gamma-glutamylcyclotransferase (GGCT)/AIG2-like uncharacterized protein YtfP